MKDDLTKLTLETLQYRKEQLQRKAGQVERLLSGQDKSLLPLLRDEAGNYSEEKTWALVEELVDSLELHQRFRNTVLAKKDTPLADLPPALEEDERRFFRSFLYCLLRLAEDAPPEYFNTNGTFGDLLEMTQDIMGYQEKVVFTLDTVFRKGFAYQTWMWMDLIRESHTGVKAADLASQEDIDAVDALYPKEAVELEMIQEEPEKDPEFLEKYSEPLEDWEIEEAEEERQAMEQWLKSFPEKDRFCREYESWRSDYFSMSFRGSLDDWIGAMLDVYFYREGSSSFLTDKTYFSAYALLNRAVKQLQSLLDGEG